MHGADRGQQAREHLVRRHFHAEDADRGLVLRADGRVLGHVHGERGLTHRGATRHDHEVAAAQAAGDLVEVGEAGGQALQRIGVLVGRIDLVDQARHASARDDGAVAPAEAGFGDLEHFLLGLVDELASGMPFRVEHGTRRSRCPPR